MLELGWSAPLCPVDAGTAARGILWQHRQIRSFLARARSIADLALDGDSPAPDAVASVVGDLRSLMEVHLSFEERVLIPLLAKELPDGPERSMRLMHEHNRQRQVLAELHQEARSHPLLPTLAAKLAFLTSWLLTDMAEEERSLASDRDRLAGPEGVADCD